MVAPRRILCAVDFSAGSRHGLEYAVALAHLCGASLAVLYVHPMPVPIPAAGASVAMPSPSLTDQQRGQIIETLSEFVADDRRAGLSIDTLFDEDPIVPRAIAQSAGHLRADLIVLGTHGHSGFNRLALGSVTSRVLKTAAQPVLAVPPRVKDAVPLGFHRILCPVDFSSASRAALDAALCLAERSGARVTAVHVLDVGGDAAEVETTAYAGYRAERFEQARAAMRAVTASALARRAPIDDLLLVGKPYREILRVAGDQHADLVVIGTQGGAAGSAGLGSTTRQVVRQTLSPVLTVPATS